MNIKKATNSVFSRKTCNGDNVSSFNSGISVNFTFGSNTPSLIFYINKYYRKW